MEELNLMLKVTISVEHKMFIIQNEVNNMIMNEKEGTKYPRSGGTGEKTPFYRTK